MLQVRAGLALLAWEGQPLRGLVCLGNDGASLLTLSFSLNRLDINTNTYTSQDLKSALAKFKEGAEKENSKEDKVCDVFIY